MTSQWGLIDVQEPTTAKCKMGWSSSISSKLLVRQSRSRLSSVIKSNSKMKSSKKLISRHRPAPPETRRWPVTHDMKVPTLDSRGLPSLSTRWTSASTERTQWRIFCSKTRHQLLLKFLRTLKFWCRSFRTPRMKSSRRTIITSNRSYNLKMKLLSWKSNRARTRPQLELKARANPPTPNQMLIHINTLFHNT